MGNAVAIGTSTRSSWVLQRSRGLLSSSSPLMANESPSFVASPRLYSRQPLADFSFSTAGSRSCSCSSTAPPSPAAATRFPLSASSSKPRRKCVKDRNSMVGGAQNPAMVPVTTQQDTSVDVMEKALEKAMEKALSSVMAPGTSKQAHLPIEEKFEEVIAKALVSVVEKNLAKFERGVAEALADKLAEKEVKLKNGNGGSDKAMEKCERGMEELRNMCGEMDTKLKGFIFMVKFSDVETNMKKSEEYCRIRDAEINSYIENQMKEETQVEASFKRGRKRALCK